MLLNGKVLLDCIDINKKSNGFIDDLKKMIFVLRIYKNSYWF